MKAILYLNRIDAIYFLQSTNLLYQINFFFRRIFLFKYEYVDNRLFQPVCKVHNCD